MRKSIGNSLGSQKERRIEVVLFLLGLALVGFIVSWAYRLTTLSLSVPIEFSGDSVLTMSAINNMVHQAWYFSTPHVGFPFGQSLQDFPAVADGFFLFVMRLLTLVSSNPAAVFNVLFVAAFPLNYVGAYVGLKICKVRPSVAMGGAIVYALLPFNFGHGPGHVALVWNWSIPIWMSYVLMQLAQLSIDRGGKGLRVGVRRSYLDRKRLNAVVPLLIGVVASVSGFYYFVFFLLVAVPSGVCEAYYVRRLRECQLLKSVGFGLLMFAVQISPILFFQRRFGGNLEVAKRSLGEVAFYGLKPLGLMMSPGSSPFRGLVPWPDGIDLNAENAVSLGILLGLVILTAPIVALISPRWHSVECKLITLFLLISIPYAGGYVLGVLGFTQVRVWSRSAVVLGFLGISLVCRLLDKYLSDPKKSLKATSFVYVTASILVLIQVVDSVPRVVATKPSEISSEWADLRRFTKSMENIYGPDAKVFQVPIVPFPENPPVERMTDYEHLKPYLVEPRMFFSYGGVKGRSIPWADRLSTDPKEQIREIAGVGFDALWVDRFGWSGESPYEIVLKNEFGLSPLVDQAERYAVYDLRGLPSNLPQSEKARILSPVLARFGDGFGPNESDGTGSWRWAGKTGNIEITNLSKTRARVGIRMEIELRQVGGLKLPEDCKVYGSTKTLERTVKCRLSVPPSGVTLKIATTNPPYIDDDPRDLRFRVMSLETE